MKNFLIIFFVAVLHFNICSAQTTDKESSVNNDKIIAIVYDKEIRMNEKDNLNVIILKSVLERYAKSHNIEPTEIEIETYRCKLDEFYSETKKRWKQDQKKLLERLESKDISESERQHIVSQLEMLKKILKVDPELEKYRKKNQQEVQKAEDKIAKHVIQTWKINKALFQQYGGRLIAKCGVGLLPIDAYRNLLKEEEEKGSFQILDKSFDATFWDYYINDSRHRFFSGTQAKQDKFFETPWGHLDNPIDE